MKKLFAVLLVTAVLAGLAACTPSLKPGNASLKPFKAGTWIVVEDGGDDAKTYTFTDSMTECSYCSGLACMPFDYEISGSSYIFHMGSADDNSVVNAVFDGDEDCTLTWEDSGRVETIQYVGDKEPEKEVNIYMVLVNKQNKLPDNWENMIELATGTNSVGENYLVEKKALEAFEKLRAALLEEGIDIELDSTYRTVEYQQKIWDEFEDEKGLDYARQYVAVPGFSEHHTGLAIDVMLIKDGEVIDDNDDMIAEKEIFAKVHARLAEFGFILRYPEGKDEITGYSYEPWHFRYIDSPEIAKEIMDSGITLEEYLGKQ